MATNHRTVPAAGRVDSRLAHVAAVLTDPKQREILDALSRISDEALDLDTLADRLYRREVFDGDRADVAEVLHDVYLPRFANMGVIGYDQSTRSITHLRWRVADVLVVARDALDVESR